MDNIFGRNFEYFYKSKPSLKDPKKHKNLTFLGWAEFGGKNYPTGRNLTFKTWPPCLLQYIRDRNLLIREMNFEIKGHCGPNFAFLTWTNHQAKAPRLKKPEVRKRRKLPAIRSERKIRIRWQKFMTMFQQMLPPTWKGRSP